MVSITKEVYSEVYDIIQHMEESLVNKIPKSFIDFISKKRDENLEVKIDYSKKIIDQNLQMGTRVILSLIYRDYICNEEQREKIIKKDQEELLRRQEELKQKYNTDNLFKRISKEEEVKEQAIVVYKETLIQRILKLLKIKR